MIFALYPSLAEALKTLYPDFPWNASQFWESKKLTPPGYFRDPNNLRPIIEDIGKKLGVNQVSSLFIYFYFYFLFFQLSDWYGIARKDVQAEGGSPLFYHHSSLESLLRSVYPDFDWEVSKFPGADRATKGHWKQEANITAAMENAETQLGIKEV